MPARAMVDAMRASRKFSELYLASSPSLWLYRERLEEGCSHLRWLDRLCNHGLSPEAGSSSSYVARLPPIATCYQ